MPDPRHKREAARPAERNIKMALVNSEYLSEYPGQRFPAGAVIEVEEDTADRWERLGIAIPADEAAKTHREQERENLKARLAQMEREEAEYQQTDRFRRSVNSSQTSPRPMPNRARDRRRLEEARTSGDVVNAAESNDDDDESEGKGT